jgi:hypothetical protein
MHLASQFTISNLKIDLTESFATKNGICKITWRGDVLGAKAKIFCVLHNKDTKLLTKAGA